MKRQIEIDILKFLGLFLVILAHVECCPALFLARSFDVPLMVFASGLAYAGRATFPPYFDFCLKRCSRLVVPVILFLIVYFTLSMTMGAQYDMETLLRTFLSLDGIGYVWIIRVFLLLMLVTPVLCILSRGDYKWLGVFVVGAFLLYSFLMYHYNDVLPKIVRAYLPYMVGYAFVFFSALLFVKADIQWRIIQLLLWMVVTIGLICVTGEFNPYSSKYPPYGLYIAYGITCSASLFLMCKIMTKYLGDAESTPRCGRVFFSSFIVYISTHTIWIYLWHIPMLSLVFSMNIESWAMRWLCVSLLSIVAFDVQRRFALFIAAKIKNEKLSDFIIKYITK